MLPSQDLRVIQEEEEEEAAHMLPITDLSTKSTYEHINGLSKISYLSKSLSLV